MFQALLSVVALISSLFHPNPVDPIVITPYGAIEGFELDSANVFLGIRYAKAPNGDLRLEKPEKVEQWTDTLQAKEYGPMCLQGTRLTDSEDFNEDCLFMNIVVPKERTSNTAKFPVFFFIHGGGFQFGSPRDYNLSVIAQNFVNKGIIFVSIQYRLGTYGFLTTEDTVLPGNLGLWDQKVALDFAREILPSFGGDIDRITVGGESAGAASVSAMALSPHTRDNFAQAVQISGSIFASFAMGNDSYEYNRRFIEAIGCYAFSSMEVKTCLKKKSVKEFFEAAGQTTTDFDALFGVPFHPRVDGDFLPAEPSVLMDSAPVKPTISGVNDKELGGFVLDGFNKSYIDVTWPFWNSFDRSGLLEKLKITSQHIPNLDDLLVQFYADPIEPGETRNSSECLTKHIQSISDISFVIPAYLEAQEKLSHGWPVYLYITSFYSKSPQKMSLPVKGSFHSNELPYLFGNKPRFPILDNEASRQFMKNIVDAYFSFIKTGKPTIESLQWKPISKAEDDAYLSLDLKCTMKEGFMRKSIKFWTKEVMNVVDKTKLKPLFPDL